MFSVRVLVLYVALIYFDGIVNGDDDFKTVDTNDGAIRGRRSTTFLKNTPFYSFKGIPYAKPPVGNLRFKVISMVFKFFFSKEWLH